VPIRFTAHLITAKSVEFASLGKLVSAMFDPDSIARSLNYGQKRRLRELLRAGRKIPAVPIDSDLASINLLRNIQGGNGEQSELNNWGWQVAMRLE
jgi:hypothetical protein